MSSRRSCTRSAPFQRSIDSVPATCTACPAALQQRGAELLAGRAERDRVDRRRRRRRAAARGRATARPPRHRPACGPGTRAPAPDCRRRTARPGRGRVTASTSAPAALSAPSISSASSRRAAVTAAASACFEVGAERRQRVLAQRDARRHGVAAALEQQPLADRLPHHAAEIDAGDRAARAGADAARLERDRKRRAAEALLEPRGDQADDAGMPAFGGGDDDRALLLDAERRHRLGFGLRDGRHFDRLALAVETVELGGDARGLGRIAPAAAARRRASARPMRPPALMRGPSRKPRCHGSGGPPSRATSISAVSPTCSRRRSASRPLVTKARLRPLSGTTSATVPSATRSSTPSRSGSGRASVQKPRRAQLAVHRDHGHEHEADRGEMAEPGQVVEPVRIDHRERGRQHLVGQVMVDHDRRPCRAASPRRAARGWWCRNRR